MNITENIIRDSVVRNLSKTFGTTYKYYKEDVPEGFFKPSFVVQRILSTRNDGMKMKKKMYEQTYDYVISYFATNDRGNTFIQECNDVLDQLYQVFEYLEVKDNENVVSKVRTGETTGEIIEGILRFNVSVYVRLYTDKERDKIQSMKLIEKIKEEK